MLYICDHAGGTTTGLEGQKKPCKPDCPKAEPHVCYDDGDKYHRSYSLCSAKWPCGPVDSPAGRRAMERRGKR